MRTITLSGLLLTALTAGVLVSRSADAGPPSTYIQCVHVKSGPVAQKAEHLDNGRAEKFTVPPGWTPVGGYAVSSVNGNVGVTILCR